MESDADDLITENPDVFQIITSTTHFDSICSFLEDKKITMVSAEIIWSPKNRVEIDDYKKAEQIMYIRHIVILKK